MESTLSIVWQEYEARVGSFLGWGRGAKYGDSPWTPQQQFEIDGIVSSALRQFYFPAPIDGETSSYNWSFLKPTSDLSLAQGGTTAPLPDDFGGMEGEAVVSGTNAVAWFPLDFVGQPAIERQAAQYPTTTGRPLSLCVEPLRGQVPPNGQRFQVRVWPIADQDYTLRVQYYILPDYLSGSFPYAYGGAEHTETILESCLAIAEERLDDMPRGMGPHSLKFRERLIASVNMDRRKKPQLVGYNRDQSDLYGRLYPPRYARFWGAPGITINGVMPG